MRTVTSFRLGRVASRSTLTAAPLLGVTLLAGCAMDGGGGAGDVPTPAEIIGFAPGEDYKLTNYGGIKAYFEALAASTDRMVLEQIGESTRGEPLYLAAISSPANLRRMERLKEITRTLAYARDPGAGYGSVLAEDEARALAREGVAIVWIDGGLHATEVAHGQVMPEMAHHFVTGRVPGDAADPRQRDRPADGEHEPGRTQHRGRLVHVERRRRVRDGARPRVVPPLHRA